MIDLDLDENDDIDFVHQVRPIIAGVVRMVEPRDLFVVKVDGWFGERWLGFTYKFQGVAGVQHRLTLRVPPFVPARVVSQRFYCRGAGGSYAAEATSIKLHVEQTSEANTRRLMSSLCPDAVVFWWSGKTRPNGRGCLMTYRPTSGETAKARKPSLHAPHQVGGHVGWYAELKNKDGWKVGKTLCTTAQELSMFAIASRTDTPGHLDR